MSAVRLVGLTTALSVVYGVAASPYFAVRKIEVNAPDSNLAKEAGAQIDVPPNASTLLYPVQRIVEALEARLPPC